MFDTMPCTRPTAVHLRLEQYKLFCMENALAITPGMQYITYIVAYGIISGSIPIAFKMLSMYSSGIRPNTQAIPVIMYCLCR